MIGLSSGAFIGPVISFALVLLLAHAAGGTPDRVILAGVAATQLFSALTSFIVITSADPEQTRGVMFWLLGSLGGADWLDVALCRCGGRSRPRGLSDSLPRTRRLCLRRGRGVVAGGERVARACDPVVGNSLDDRGDRERRRCHRLRGPGSSRTRRGLSSVRTTADSCPRPH